jgi:hypothetical protein
MINYNAKQYTQNSSENENFSNIEKIFTTTSSDPYNNAHIQNSTFAYYSGKSYNEYRKDTEEILEMFTEATKELSECERKLINDKFYDLFLNKKIKLNIEINDEEKI